MEKGDLLAISRPVAAAFKHRIDLEADCCSNLGCLVCTISTCAGIFFALDLDGVLLPLSYNLIMHMYGSIQQVAATSITNHLNQYRSLSQLGICTTTLSNINNNIGLQA